jgi:hypothetical protein
MGLEENLQRQIDRAANYARAEQQERDRIFAEREGVFRTLADEFVAAAKKRAVPPASWHRIEPTPRGSTATVVRRQPDAEGWAFRVLDTAGEYPDGLIGVSTDGYFAKLDPRVRLVRARALTWLKERPLGDSRIFGIKEIYELERMPLTPERVEQAMVEWLSKPETRPDGSIAQ